MAKRNPHIGSNFDDFLSDEGLLEETTALALKRVIAWQLDEARKARGLSKKAMAERMNTSRAQLDRILDADDTSLTLETLSRASRAVGCRVSVELAGKSASATARKSAAKKPELQNTAGKMCLGGQV